MYAPHILYKKVTTVERNNYGELVSSKDTWQEVGECRCDDNTTQRFTTDNGSVYVPKYHIVLDKSDVKAGDYVKAVDKETKEVRGEGKVFNAPKCNYLEYMSVYV
jgi:hypothetical protein